MVTQPQVAFLIFVGLFIPSELGYNHVVPPWQQYYPRVMNHYEHHKGGRPERIRSGHGRYRMLPRGAELICDFPSTALLLSNIIWERADLGALRSLDEIYKSVGETREYNVAERPRGSTLNLHSLSPLDRGLYRCIVTALDPNTSKVVTLFQDVPFYPDFSLAPKILPPLPPYKPPCCRLKHLYKDFSHHSSVYAKSSTLYVQ